MPLKFGILTVNWMTETLGVASMLRTGEDAGKEVTAFVNEIITVERGDIIIQPEGSVYSFFLFMPPVEQQRTGRRCTWIMTFATWLVALNLIMQFGLLYIITPYVVNKHAHFVGNFVRLENQPRYQVHKLRNEHLSVAALSGTEAVAGHQCMDDSTLCYQRDGMVSCGPQSVLLLSQWDLLDRNGDGMWSLDEAKDDKFRDQVRCSHNVDPLDVYQHTVHELQTAGFLDDMRDKNLTRGTGVQRAYMDWFMHEPLLCLYGDQDMCGNLFVKGVFDEAIRQKDSAMNTTGGALRYCKDLLQNRCEKILPNSYASWRKRSVEQCGVKSFDPQIYRSPPGKGEDIQVLFTQFFNQKIYKRAKTSGFLVFLVILTCVFLATMMSEVKQITWMLFWCWYFPGPTDETKDEESHPLLKRRASKRTSMLGTSSKTFDIASSELDELDAEGHTIYWYHRLCVLIMTVLRFGVWIILLYAGTLFLTSGADYLGLIFDALSLVFIINIDEIIYENMIRVNLTNDHQNAAHMTIPWKSYTNPVVNDFIGSVFLVAVAIGVVMEYFNRELVPLADALGCMCLIDGDKCMEAQMYSKEWWDNYWAKILPGALSAIREFASLSARADL